MKTNDKIRALIDAYTELAMNEGYSEISIMLALFDIFNPKELIELGYEERVSAFNEECEE